MARTVEEWIGKTPDTAIPPRVRVRVFDSKSGHCHKCHRKIRAGEKWTCEHLIALINGGENRERNLDVTCDWCLPSKNAADVAEKSTVYHKRAKHLGIRKQSTFPKRSNPWGRVKGNTKSLEDL
jgi:5-methylcytosine-specific restriction protein A